MSLVTMECYIIYKLPTDTKDDTEAAIRPGAYCSLGTFFGKVFLNYIYCVSLCGVGQKTKCEGWLFPSTMWVQGI